VRTHFLFLSVLSILDASHTSASKAFPSSNNWSTLSESAPSTRARAEVVELADTPSCPIGLFILYKLLILNLLPFASSTSIVSHSSGQ
jgi:hypothetical protein